MCNGSGGSLNTLPCLCVCTCELSSERDVAVGEDLSPGEAHVALSGGDLSHHTAQRSLQ